MGFWQLSWSSFEYKKLVREPSKKSSKIHWSWAVFSFREIFYKISFGRPKPTEVNKSSTALTLYLENLGFTKFCFKQMLKVSAFYLEKQKNFIPKKTFLSRCQYQNKKALFTDSIFRDGFVPTYIRYISLFSKIRCSWTYLPT